MSSAAGPRLKYTATEGKNGATRRWRGGSVNGWERRERERAARRRWSRRARARRASEGNGACAATNATRNLACSVALALIIPSRRRAQYLLLAGGLAWPCWRLCKLKVAESRYVAGGTVASLRRVQHLIVNCLGNSNPNSPNPNPHQSRGSHRPSGSPPHCMDDKSHHLIARQPQASACRGRSNTERPPSTNAGHAE